MAQLSGGQKTMVALCLIFAICGGVVPRAPPRPFAPHRPRAPSPQRAPSRADRFSSRQQPYSGASLLGLHFSRSTSLDATIPVARRSRR